MTAARWSIHTPRDLSRPYPPRLCASNAGTRLQNLTRLVFRRVWVFRDNRLDLSGEGSDLLFGGAGEAGGVGE